MPKLSALDISLYFIQLASKIDENDLTNLKLQKLLYLAQGRYMAKTGKQLFSDQIEAWSLGPVVRTVYDTYKVCGLLTMYMTNSMKSFVLKYLKLILNCLCYKMQKITTT